MAPPRAAHGFLLRRVVEASGRPRKFPPESLKLGLHPVQFALEFEKGRRNVPRRFDFVQRFLLV